MNKTDLTIAISAGFVLILIGSLFVGIAYILQPNHLSQKEQMQTKADSLTANFKLALLVSYDNSTQIMINQTTTQAVFYISQDINNKYEMNVVLAFSNQTYMPLTNHTYYQVSMLFTGRTPFSFTYYPMRDCFPENCFYFRLVQYQTGFIVSAGPLPL